MREAIRSALLRASWDTPAVPMHRLTRELRDQGKAVTDTAVRRSLRRDDARARVVTPWAGGRSAMARLCRTGPETAAHPHILPPDHPWVIPGPGDDDPPDPHAPPSARLRRTLLTLGDQVDERSPGDLARWFALMEEAGGYEKAA